jgi:hypothetical protein
MSVRDRMVNGKAVYRSGDIDLRATAKRPQPPSRDRSTSRVQRNPLDCVHLLEQLGRSVEQTGCGCRGNRFVSVWECELVGAAAPFARGALKDADVTRCRDCRQYEAAATEGQTELS